MQQDLILNTGVIHLYSKVNNSYLFHKYIELHFPVLIIHFQFSM